MELQLMKLRKAAGYKNRDDFAKVIGVNRHTYRSWESGASMMSLEQAFEVTEALGCTLDELVGREPSRNYVDRRQAAVNGYYESMSEDGKNTLLKVARGLGKDGANRIEKDRAEYVQDASAFGA